MTSQDGNEIRLEEERASQPDADNPGSERATVVDDDEEVAVDNQQEGRGRAGLTDRQLERLLMREANADFGANIMDQIWKN